MKKLYILFVLITISAIGAIAQDFTYSDLKFTINEDNETVTLTGHINGFAATGQINIPSVAYHDGTGYTVTRINQQAFYYCEGLTGQLIIPDSVEEIGDMAFYRCVGFTGLILSGGLTDIGNDVFNYCGFTGTVVFPENLKSIGTTPFYYCDGIEGFIVDEGNELYDSRNNCNSVISTPDNSLLIGCKNSTIPNTVTSIADGAFINVTGLTAINIPNSVRSIGIMSFWNTGLTSIKIPTSVSSIGENPFGGCTELATITVESGNNTFDSRNNCNAIIETSRNMIISGCKNTVIPNDIRSIGNNAFINCTELSGELVLPEGILSIGAYAFNRCTGLTGSLTLPNSLIVIGESAFADCSGFNGRLTLSESMTTIPNLAFDGCVGFTDTLVIPNSVTTIGARAFKDCYGFNKTLVLSSNLNTINSFAFSGCAGFTDIVSLAETPPELNGYPFGSIEYTMLVVPCGCIEAYENSSWYNQFNTIVEDCGDITEFEANALSVYPNPTKGIVRIEAKNIQNISIFNVLGELVFKSEVNEDAFEYDFGKHECGVYFVKAATAESFVTKKIVIE